MPALVQQRHGLLVNAFQVLPAAIQSRQHFFQGQVQAAPGGVGRLGRLPMRILAGLLGRLPVGGNAGEHFGPGRLVFLLERPVLRLELRRGRRPRRGVLLFGRRFLAAIAAVQQASGLLIFLLGRFLAGDEAALDLPFGRDALGDQLAEIRQQLPRHFGRRCLTHRFTSNRSRTAAPRRRAPRPDE